MKGFEKYLKENKKELELESVNPEIWLSIENEVLKKKNKKNVFRLRMISAIAATLLLLILALNVFPLDDGKTLEARVLEQYDLQKYNFPKKINTKTKTLAKAKIPKDRKEDFDLLLVQLEFLDEQYHDYLQFVQTNGSQEFIGEQILHYYKSKLELLDKIQFEIKKINEYENQYDSPSEKVELML